MGRRVLREAARYQFNTFSIGMIIPEDVQEREDQLRSDLQIRGKGTIKSQIAGEIAGYVKRQIHKKIDHKRPELTVLVDFKAGLVLPTSKSLYIHARYTKPSGVSQRREFCEKCAGRGCNECKDGYADVPSMEEVLTRSFARVFLSPKAKFTWIGSEDSDSIVYPPGRPFIAEIKNPRRRKMPAHLRMVTGRGRAELLCARILKSRPLTVPSFVFKTRALIRPVEHEKVRIAHSRRFGKTTVYYKNNKGKTVEKTAYAFRVGSRGRVLVAEIKLDGGLPVKRFVSGESVSPSLSEIIGIPLVCQKFDIVRVWETNPIRFDLPRRDYRSSRHGSNGKKSFNRE